MLFTDGPFILAQDLENIDGEFLTLAQKLNIVVDASANSVLTNSTNALGQHFLSKIQNFSGYLVGVGGASNHVAAVLNILSTAINRPRALLQQIPVIEPDPTRTAFIRWARFYCLHDFYRSIFGRKLEDRYEKKMNFYGAETKRYWELLKMAGFPVIIAPLSAPGATLDYGSGTWNASNLSQTVGSASGGSFDVVITWCCLPAYQSPTAQNNAESAGSQIASATIASGHLLTISLAGLNPPTGLMNPAIGTARGVYAPMNATHWNVYVRPSGTGNLTLQNATPIPVGTTTYTLAADPTTTGAVLNAGQNAQYDFALNEEILWRA